jgi:predicted transcriptional regulator of viral defense system
MQHQNITIPSYIEQLQSSGKYWFTYKSLSAATSKTEKAIERSLSRLREQKRVANPRKSFYVIVSPEYRAFGCPPVTWFIDDMMKFAGEAYYVGLLSAAELYGAAHHKPQEFQVITEYTHRPLECGRTRIRFFAKRYLEKTLVQAHKTRTGYMQVSSPEATALDLVRYSFELGGLSSVGAIIAELSEKMKIRNLLKASAGYELSVVQRLGFILEKLNQEQLAEPLSKWLVEKRPRVILLSNNQQITKQNKVRKINNRWALRVNEELDLEP